MAKFERSSKKAIKGGFGGVRKTKDSAPRFDTLVEFYAFLKGGKFDQGRFVGPMIAEGVHWIPVKKKDGSMGQFPKKCLAFDPITQVRDSTKSCPYCKFLPSKTEKDRKEYRFQVTYYRNWFSREAQEDKPRKLPKLTPSEAKTGFKDINSKSWTPCRVVPLKPSLCDKLQRIEERNIHVVKDKKGNKVKKSFDIGDDKYGMDVALSFDKERKGTDMYDVQKEDKSPLTEEEQGYLLWDLDLNPEPEDEASALAEVTRLGFGPNAEKSKKKGKGPVDDEEEEEALSAGR